MLGARAGESGGKTPSCCPRCWQRHKKRSFGQQLPYIKKSRNRDGGETAKHASNIRFGWQPSNEDDRVGLWGRLNGKQIGLKKTIRSVHIPIPLVEKGKQGFMEVTAAFDIRLI